MGARSWRARWRIDRPRASGFPGLVGLGRKEKVNFVLLTDDKNACPIYNPAPLVRDALLAKSPTIASVLNPLAPKLTTAVIVQLNSEVAVQHESVDQATRT